MDHENIQDDNEVEILVKPTAGDECHMLTWNQMQKKKWSKMSCNCEERDDGACWEESNDSHLGKDDKEEEWMFCGWMGNHAQQECIGRIHCDSGALKE